MSRYLLLYRGGGISNMEDEKDMKTAKNIMKKSFRIVSYLLVIASTLNPFFETILNVSAATIVTSSLTPGSSYDVSVPNWTLSDFQTSSKYTPVGKGTSGNGWTSGSTYNFGVNGQNRGSWLPFNGAVDMRKPISISGLTFANAGGINPGTHLGDTNGIILTNLSSSQLSGGATGGNLGIGNLGSGTYFIGNNYSHKQYYTFGDVNTGYQTASVIAQASGSGASILNASSDYTAKNNSNNTFTMTWSNPVVNADGSVTGTISYTSINSGTSYTATSTLTVQQSMSIGFIGATGGNYSDMSVTINGVTAGRGNQNVIVNYINSVTGQQIPTAASSGITANVGDKIGVVSSGSSANTSDDYDFFAPSLSGYKLTSISSPIVVNNFASGSANPNVINVTYTPNSVSGLMTTAFQPNTVPGTYNYANFSGQPLDSNNINFKWLPSSSFVNVSVGLERGVSVYNVNGNQVQNSYAQSINPGVLFVSPWTLGNNGQNISQIFSGLVGSAMTLPTYSIGGPYSVSGVVRNDGTTYTSLADAQSKNPNFNATNNNFVTLYQANQTSLTTNYVYSSGSTGPALPAGIPTSGAAGSLIGNTSILMPKTMAGYSISVSDTLGYLKNAAYSDQTAFLSNLWTGLKAKYPNISSSFGNTSVVPSNLFLLDANDTLTFTYTALPQSGTVSFAWDTTVPGQNGVPGQLQGSLPGSIALSGKTNDLLTFTAGNIPAGYSIGSVVGPDGKTYTDSTTAGMTALQAAQAANKVFVNGANDFKINLKAVSQQVTLNTVIDHTNGPSTPANPAAQVITTGLTGAPISTASVSTTQTWLNNWITTNAQGFSIKNYVDVKGNIYTNANLQAAVAGAGGYILSANNVYTVNLIYNGTLTFVSSPNTIDFGTHSVSAGTQKYSGSLDQSVIVSDTRASILASDWSVSVSQSSPIQEVIQTGTDASGNPLYSPVLGGLSFLNLLTYNGNNISNVPQVVYSNTTHQSGKFTVVDKDKASPFQLTVPSDHQKINTKFKGTVTWTLTSAP